MTGCMTICLASASPRRRLMLDAAGYDVFVHPSDLDDAHLRRGAVSPVAWVMALAWFKARRVAVMIEQLDQSARTFELPPVILGADTVCVHDEKILGQPRDEADARRMIELMRNATHCTLTGLCLLDMSSGRRFLARDRAEVAVGDIGDEQIEAYVRSGHWRGKAGAYNLSERLEAGWPIQCRGDPATVMGLPMRKLPQWIERFRSVEP